MADFDHTIENIIEIIKKYEVKGSKFGLDRTRKLLDSLGAPDDELKIIHIAGTNGKGTTSAYITNILISAGKKVGTFTSPEVYSYNEKFAVNGQPLTDEKLKKYLSCAYNMANSFEDSPTAFEIETATAMLAFKCEGCEYAVVECGMGGLNDSTNAIHKKLVAVITSIGLEHTAILGDTLLKISEQKAGIIKNCHAIVSCLQDKEVLDYFKSLGTFVAGEGLNIKTSGLNGQSFSYKGKQYEIKMCGNAQAYNASTAIEVANYLGIGDDDIRQGLAKTKLLGRVEVIEKGYTYVLDGSHNPASFSPLVDVIKEDKRDKVLVYACLSDKNVDAAANILSGCFDRAFVFSPDSYRAMDGEKIYKTFKKYFKDVELCDGLVQALERARAQLITVCGTFTILKEAKEWIEKR
jgi:dihydrofolate synthase/folylpolyglutamate synthase